mmetsp:Transcript_42655/g.101295  ORF Transcript_42655/g.101295 Transcript_42655/m.101295 type:complete len:281 (+) Transcript_42655:2330-3172(+)
MPQRRRHNCGASAPRDGHVQVQGHKQLERLARRSGDVPFCHVRRRVRRHRGCAGGDVVGEHGWWEHEAEEAQEERIQLLRQHLEEAEEGNVVLQLLEVGFRFGIGPRGGMVVVARHCQKMHPPRLAEFAAEEEKRLFLLDQLFVWLPEEHRRAAAFPPGYVSADGARLRGDLQGPEVHQAPHHVLHVGALRRDGSGDLGHLGHARFDPPCRDPTHPLKEVEVAWFAHLVLSPHHCVDIGLRRLGVFRFLIRLWWRERRHNLLDNRKIELDDEAVVPVEDR